MKKQKITSLLFSSALLFASSAFSAPPGTLSVHILNQQTGRPSAKVAVTLEKQQAENWVLLASGTTDDDGRIASLYPADKDMEPGVYRITFKTGDYFASQHLQTFFPQIPVLFTVAKTNEKLHIPLLLSQYGYATYRGS